MQAIVLEHKENFVVKSVPDPVCGPKQVVLKMAACGICGTDVHIYHGEFITQFPLIPGHEMAGEVVEVGADVTDWKVGDRVVVDNAIYDSNDPYARINQEHMSLNFRSQGCTEDGGFAEYVAVDQDRLYDIGAMPWEVAAFAEPTACCVHAIRKSSLQLGDTVALWGAGPVGLVLLQLFLRSGASKVVVADPNPWKLEQAQALGATHTVHIQDRNDFTEANKEFLEYEPLGYNEVFDATGKDNVLENAYKLVKRGGEVVFFGVPNNDSFVKVPAYEIFLHEIRTIGTFAQLYTFAPTVNILKAGLIDVASLVSHRYPLGMFPAAFDLMLKSRDKMKIQIHHDLTEPVVQTAAATAAN